MLPPIILPPTAPAELLIATSTPVWGYLHYAVNDFNFPPAQIKRNRHHFLQALNVDPAGLLTVHQTHSADWVRVEPPTVRWSRARAPHADGLVTTLVGRALGISTADCIPLVLYHAGNKKLANIHLGWRGLLNPMLAEVVHEVGGTTPQNIYAYLAPHIQRCCYHVPQAPAAWKAQWGKSFSDDYLDLTDYLIQKLTAFGLTQIAVSPYCTGCTQELPSHYRLKDQRQFSLLTVAMIRPA